MKKILSLVLAVLMLASLAVSTSAVKIVDSDGPGFLSGSMKNDKATVSDIYDIYDLLDRSVPYGGAINYKGDTIYTWWYDDCPDCDGLAFHYVSHGKINWKCLESKCGKTGVIGYDYDDDVEEDDNDLEDYIFDYVKCSHHYCSKLAQFDYFFTSGGKLYAHYECSEGHDTDKPIYSDFAYDFDDYDVYVTCSRGGTYDIIGGSDAYYGEVKTIEFYPNKGYVLTDVLVDGESVEADSNNQIKITVKKDTVVRAYFEKVSNLKDYTVTVASSGHGKIYVKKNDVSVTTASVKANYTDTITYKFVPDSKNYKVASVKVNGQSIGAPATYTVSKLSSDTKISVVFEWDNPYVDVKEKYENAVEYVTESGIMTIGTLVNKHYYFNGNVQVSVRSFAEALAEMADTADKLDDTAERIEWADKYDIVDADDDLTVGCDVQTACDMVYAYLKTLEDINDIDFDDLDGIKNAKDAAIAIDMVTAPTYEKNRYLNRYDLAAVCYLIAGLEYDAD